MRARLVLGLCIGLAVWAPAWAADPEPAQNVRVVGSAGQVVQQVVSVTTTATKLPTTPITGRKVVIMQNLCSTDVWLGKSTVTATGSTRGLKLQPGASANFEAGPTIDGYGIVGSGTCDVAVFERS